MKFIGITGGVGAGKSTVLNFFREQEKTKVLLADDIAKELMEPGSTCMKEIEQVFRGEDIFLPDHSLDREKMAKIVFSDENKRKKLNEIVHPAVKKYIIEVYKTEREKGTLDYLILEAALLIEEHYDEICDELWYIYTSEDNRAKRLRASRHYSNEKIRQMFLSQLSEEVYREHCSVVIDNNGSSEETRQQIQKTLKEREAHG